MSAAAATFGSQLAENILVKFYFEETEGRRYAASERAKVHAPLAA